jgi:hypothetical protein
MQLLSLKASLDDYHQRRANKHGYLYYVIRVIGPSQSWPGVVEAKSLSTGHTVTLVAPYYEVKEVEDGPQLP